MHRWKIHQGTGGLHRIPDDGLHGVSCLYDSSDQKIVEIVEIDLQQVDLKMLQKEGILSFGTNTIPDGLSLSSSKEYLSNLGFIFD